MVFIKGNRWKYASWMGYFLLDVMSIVTIIWIENYANGILLALLTIPFFIVVLIGYNHAFLGKLYSNRFCYAIDVVSAILVVISFIITIAIRS